MRPSPALGWRTRCTAACLVLALLLVGVASGCDGTSGSRGEAGGSPPVPSSGVRADRGFDAFDAAESDAPECSAFTSWRDAQDALELDFEYAPYLDADGNGGACDDLSQMEYEDGWVTGYAEGCAAIFDESPDGYLYSSAVQYEVFDCEGADPGPDEWDFSVSPSEEPETDGAHDGWEAACAATFQDVVGDDLYWGDEDVWVTQADCELANAY